MTTENICTCGHEKYQHQKQGCIAVLGNVTHVYCHCKKFEPQNQSQDTKVHDGKDNQFILPDTLRGSKRRTIFKGTFGELKSIAEEQGFIEKAEVEKILDEYFNIAGYKSPNYELLNQIRGELKKRLGIK